MNIRTSLLNRAVKTAILTLGIFSATQAQAIVPPNMDYPIIDQIPVIDEVFLQADANGDGQLSVDEFYQLHSAASLIEFETTFKAMDGDQSRDVNLEEFLQFLPSKDVTLADEQFINAAGEDGLLDLKEFIMMRIKEQGANTDLLWKFALLDQNHNGQLEPHEFHLQPPIEPPVIIKPPLPPVDPIVIIKPPLPPIDPPVIEPEEPEEPKEPANPEEQENSVKPPVKPEKPIDNIVLHIEELVGPVKPISVSPRLIDELEEKIATVKSKMQRVEKSIERTMEKLSSATNDRKANRLERRLKRQTTRLDKLNEWYQELAEKLENAHQAMDN